MRRERREHERVTIEGWASLHHPLLGTITAEVRDISAGGMSLRLDEDNNFFVMMELEATIHSRAMNALAPPLSVQVVRVQHRRVGLRFNDREGRPTRPTEVRQGSHARLQPSRARTRHCPAIVRTR